MYEQGVIIKTHPEDVIYMSWYKNDFEDRGIKFADPKIAALFSIETEDYTYDRQFGFHDFKITNIDRWFDSHPEYTELYELYKRKKVKK